MSMLDVNQSPHRQPGELTAGRLEGNDPLVEHSDGKS